MTVRTVKQLHEAIRDDIGDLCTRRPLPNARIDQIDPFLFLNHHGPQVYPPRNHGLPFGPHPHRGFETVTFILEGDLMHRDTGGHESVIKAGGVQWMTTGRGLIHAELSSPEFMERGGGLEILQLWINLPARLKMTEPRYVGLQADQLPSVRCGEGRATLNLVSGRYGDHAGPISPLTDIHLMTIRLEPGGSVRLPVEAARNIFLYLIRGEVTVSGTTVEQHHLVEMNRDGEAVEIQAKTASMLLFGHAMPFDEPKVAYGPFVMNTREEIVRAFQDYEAGVFGSMS